VTPEGRLPIEEQVAASLLRVGADARAARLFNDHEAARSVEGLAEVLGLTAHDRATRVARARVGAVAALARAAAVGARPLPAGGLEYPLLLGHIADPPIILWRRGEDVLDLPAVAVVGSRQPSPGGRAMATRLAHGLATAGLVVVSGLARGIDAAAHEGALRAGGRTVAVLGSGVDVIYPREHGGLADEILKDGCLVSEFEPRTPPLPRHFPLRNRIISGLSLAVVVVEAAERSGSLITARMALEQGRTVCAVPGGVASGCYRGCHALIQDGAGLVETVEDILAELSWRPRGAAVESRISKSFVSSNLQSVIMPGEAVSVDDLSLRTGQSVEVLLAELGQLEVAGAVSRTGGGMFVRLD
jgi:DNA processing protein